MRRIRSLFIGFGIGGLLGALLVAFFSPVTADEFRANWRTHYKRALRAGRDASQKRRAELEAELHHLHQKPQGD